jgi:T5SS/PEP-CTERM-associated repeat protein
LIVSGAGSVINLSGALNIGTALGVGDLTIGPGATVDAAVVNLQGQVVLEGGLLDPSVITVAQGTSTGGFGAAGGTGDLIVNDGTLLAHAGAEAGQALQTFMGTIAGQGTLQIDAGTTMELTGPVLNGNPLLDVNNDGSPVTVASNQVVNFTAGGGVLRLDDFAGFAGTIGTFNAGDMIEIPGLQIASQTVNGTVLSLFDGSHTLLGTIGFTSNVPVVAGIAVTSGLNIQCVAAGTMIETMNGQRAVEILVPGDEVRTLLGGPGLIIWTGMRSVDCARHPMPESVRPIRIDRDAFGLGTPARDLFVSPDHAIYVDDVLIPAKLLMNGTTIRQIPVSRIVYHHIELTRHDVVLAEGLPVETYLDTGDRANFSGGSVTALYPNFAARTWEMAGCAPLVLTGERLAAVRRREPRAASG